MARSVEQRIKELVEPTTRAYLVADWTSNTSGFSKELNAPIFKKSGDVAALAKRYDTAADNFINSAKKKDDAKKLFEASQAPMAKSVKEFVGLKKELEDISSDENASLKLIADAAKTEDILSNWEEGLKAQQDLNKLRKTIFDRMLKCGEEYAKQQVDTIGKVKKEIATVQASLAGANNEMNALEAQIRAIIVNYQKTALEMDRKDIADAVRGYLGAAFGK